MFLVQLLLVFALCRDSNSSQIFLPLPSTVTSLVSISRVYGFANEHVTVLAAYPITKIGTTTYNTNAYRDIATTQPTPATTTYTTLRPAGTIFVAYNDAYYTHRWWPSVGPAVPNNSAFYAAQCTPHTASPETWECSSWSMTVLPGSLSGQGPLTKSVTLDTATATAVVTAHNLYTIDGAQLATELSTASKTKSTKTSSTSTYSSSFSTRTMTYSATQTSIANWI